MVKKVSRYLLAIVSIVLVPYQLAATQYLFLGIYEHQIFHLMMILLLTFLFALNKTPKLWPVWVFFIILTFVSTGYMLAFTDALLFRVGLPTNLDMVIGVILVVLALVALNAAFGKVLPIFVLVFIVYTFFGHYLPEPFYHPQVPLDRAISLMSVGFSGVFSSLLGISASYLFLFLFFASLLAISGAGAFFNELGKLAARKFAGGPGITAVVASSLFGMITGSPGANVIVTGTFTIPLMKKAGFNPDQAGGILAASATGGLIMPPIMASAAFVMAAFLGIPYIKVMLMAFPAAILYYFGCGLYVQFQAGKLGIQKTTVEIDKKTLFINAPSFLVPMAILVVLLILGYSPQFTVFWAIISVLVTITILHFKKLTSMEFLKHFLNEVIDGANSGAGVGVTLAALGVAAATVTMTGLGMKLPLAVEMWSGGILLLAVLSTVVITIILGCGLPILPSYIILSIVVAPALVRMGIQPLQAHFFILYFAAFSMVTPPVAVSALVAAKLANSRYMPTCIEAMKVSAVAYLVPFLFIWSPVILLQPAEPIGAVITILGIILASVALAGSFVGYYLTRITWLERVLLGLDGASLFVIACTKNLVPFIIAVIVFVLLTVWQLQRKKANFKKTVTA